MSEPWGVLLFERSARARGFAGDIAREAGLIQYDVLQGLRDERNYILDFLDEERAGRAASALCERGMAAVALPRSAFDFSFGAGVIRDASLDEAGLAVRSPLDGSETSVPWDTVRGVLALHRKAAPKAPTRPKPKRSHVRGYGYGEVVVEPPPPPPVTSAAGALLSLDQEDSLAPSPFKDNPLRDLLRGALGDFIFVDGCKGVDAAAAERAIEAITQHSILTGREDDVILLVMGEEPVVISAIERGGFNYAHLEDRRTLSSVQNFQVILGDMARLGRPFYCNKSFTAAAREGTLKRLEKVAGKFIERWLKERVMMVNLLWQGKVPEKALSAMDAEESLLLYLE